MGRTAQVALAGSLVVAVAAAGWLYLDNRELRDRLAKASADTPAPTAAQDPGAPAAVTDDPWAERPRAAKSTQSLLRGMSRMQDRERPELEAEPESESRADRRKRRQAEISAFLGRLDGETEDDYRARMVPLIETGLAIPRERLEEARAKAEKLAGVSDEQRAALDAAFDDVYSEVLELTNTAIAGGELTPYERNWSGVLNYAGGLGAILGSAEDRIGTILSPEQLDSMYESGFEWGEYLGVNAPWEQLTPPPPPPASDG